MNLRTFCLLAVVIAASPIIASENIPTEEAINATSNRVSELKTKLKTFEPDQLEEKATIQLQLMWEIEELIYQKALRTSAGELTQTEKLIAKQQQKSKEQNKLKYEQCLQAQKNILALGKDEKALNQRLQELQTQIKEIDNGERKHLSQLQMEYMLIQASLHQKKHPRSNGPCNIISGIVD